MPSPFLKDVMLIDSPGILSGEKQKAGRGYVFEVSERRDVLMRSTAVARRPRGEDETDWVVNNCYGGVQDVVRWFAERADEIIIMFDAHKLDISDELRNVMMAIKEHEVRRRAASRGD